MNDRDPQCERAAGEGCAHDGDVVANWSERLVHQRAHPPRVVVATVTGWQTAMEAGSFYLTSSGERSVDQYTTLARACFLRASPELVEPPALPKHVDHQKTGEVSGQRL